MTGTCATCGNPMPYRRKDGTSLKREFCSRKCSHCTAVKIVINGDQANTPKPAPMGSWWIEPDFYANTRLRFPVDAGDKSSQPVRTFGVQDFHGLGGYRHRPKVDDRG